MSESTFPLSVRAQIASLGVGESYAKCERMELELVTKDVLNERTAALRNNIAAAARRATLDTGCEYATDTIKCFTASQDLMLVAIVTRRN